MGLVWGADVVLSVFYANESITIKIHILILQRVKHLNYNFDMRAVWCIQFRSLLKRP